MAHVVIAVAVYLPSITISFLVISALALINMTVGLGENQTANTLATAGALVKLAVYLSTILINRLSITQGKVKRLNCIFGDVKKF